MKMKSHQPTCLHGPQSKSKRIYDSVGHKPSKKVPSLLFKRASRCSTSILKSYTGKPEYVEIKGGRQQMHPAALIACPGKVLTEKCKKDSVCQRLSGYKDMNRPRRRCYIACSDSSNDSSSIGSCSLNSWRQDGPFESSARHLYLESNLLYNDAESIYCSADQEDNRDNCSEEKAEMHTGFMQPMKPVGLFFDEDATDQSSSPGHIGHPRFFSQCFEDGSYPAARLFALRKAWLFDHFERICLFSM